MEIQAIHERYSPRMQALLEWLAAALRMAGYAVVGPDDWSGGSEYVWGMLVAGTEGHTDPQDDDIDVHLWVCDSESWAGDQQGVSFMLDLVTVGGRLVGQYCPKNYTEEVWVPRSDPQAIEERFSMMERLDVGQTVGLVMECLPLAA